MGFSLRHLLDDVTHPLGIGRPNPPPQQTPLPAAVTPAPNQVVRPPAATLGNRLMSVVHGVGQAGTDIGHVAGNTSKFVNNALVKPVANTVSGDILLPAAEQLANLRHDPMAAEIARQEAQKAQANSLPQMLVQPFAKLGEGLAYTPKAIYRELQNKPITDLQQRVFNTSDSGNLAKEILGNTAAAALTVAAPGTGKIATEAAAPVLDSVANPILRPALTAAVRGTATAPVGAAYNVANLEATNPAATGKDIKGAAEQGALLFGALGAAPDLAGAVKEGTPQLVQYAKDNVDVVKQAMDAINQNPRPTGLTDPEMATVSKWRDQMGSGNFVDDNLYQNAKSALAKEGINHSDPSAIDNLLGSYRTYKSRQAALQAGFVKIPGGKEAVPPGELPPKAPTPKPRAPMSSDVNAAAGAAKDAKLVNEIKQSRATPEEQQVIDAANKSIKSGDLSNAKALAESLPAKHSTPLLAQIKEKAVGSKLDAKAYANTFGVSEKEAQASLAETAATDAKLKAGEPVSQVVAENKAKRTGLVDKRLTDLQKQHAGLVKAELGDLKLANKSTDQVSVAKRVRDNGGISSSAYESLPNSVRRKAGVSADVMARDLGYSSEDDLIAALQNEAEAKGNTKSAAQLRDQAIENLHGGKSNYSGEFKKVQDALSKRQDELSLYPKGTRAQVKVSDKAPGAMSEAELQSLSATAEGKAKQAGNKVVARDEKSTIRNADAERAVLDGLQKGTHTDTVINKYMDDTGTTLQQAVKDINRVANEAGLTTDLGKNPMEGKLKLPNVQEGDWKQATLNSRFVQFREQEVGSHALQDYRALSAHDQVLLKDIETGTVSRVAQNAENPTAFKQAEQSIRTYYDTRHAYDRLLGIDVGYRTNYLRQLFDRVEKENPLQSDQISVKGADKHPGYTKQRTRETLGTDVGNALERDITGASFNHAKLAYENGLNEAFPGKIANGEIVRGANGEGTYQQLNHSFGKDLSAPKDIAHEINSRTWHPNDSRALNVYDRVNRGLKYVKLSGGLFHAFTESGNFIGQQITSGKLLTNPTATGRMFKIFFSPKAMDSELARMSDTGVLDKAHLGGLTVRSDQILADVNVKALDKGKGHEPALAKYTGVQQMHDATFQREIPYAKLKIFEQKTDGLDPNKPADLVKIRQQAEIINNLFGGINREIHGIKPGTFRWLQRGLLATDFTEGKFATLGKALTDKGPAGTTARQAVAGKVLLFGLIATAGGALGGEYKGKTAGQIAKNAAGNLADPSFEMGGYKVGLPKTHVSEGVAALKPSSTSVGHAWNASGLITYAKDRSAALPSEAISLLSNKNYYGQPLYGTNTKKNGGGKISGPQTALNVAQTGLPIPFGQATDTISGKQAPAAAVANVIGFKARPNPANAVTFDGVQTSLSDPQRREYQDLFKKNNGSDLVNQLKNSSAYKSANPNDQAKALSQLKSNITNVTNRQFASKYSLGQYASDYKGKDSPASAKEQDVAGGKINPDSYFKSTGNSDSYAVSQFKKGSAKTTTIGDQTYFKKGDGTVAHKSTFDFQNDMTSSKLAFQLDRAKANDDYTSWSTAANQKLDQLQTQIDHYDPTTEANKVDDVKKQAADLVDQMQRYASYGGQFTKPPKGRSGRSSNGISYKFFNPSPYSTKLRDLVKAAKVGKLA